MSTIAEPTFSPLLVFPVETELVLPLQSSPGEDECGEGGLASRCRKDAEDANSRLNQAESRAVEKIGSILDGLQRYEALEEFVTGLYDFMIWSDTDSNTFIKVSDSLIEFIGVDPTGWQIERCFQEFIRPGDQPTTRSFYEGYREGSTSESFSNHVRRKDGVWCEVMWDSAHGPESRGDLGFAAGRLTGATDGQPT